MRRTIVLVIASYLCTMIAILLFTSTSKENSFDIVQANDIVYTIRNYWPDIDTAIDRLSDYESSYLVIGIAGDVLGASEDSLENNYSADTIYEGKTAEIKINGEIQGKVLIIDDKEKNSIKIKTKMQRLILVIVTLFFFLICLIICYINKEVLNPIQELKKICMQIAGGNYDISIGKYESKPLGMLCDSFEMMRDELLFQQRRGQEADKNRREVIATISHDIKNPVASIQAIAEFQLYITDNEALHKEFQSIIEKTNQINYLVQNLHTSMLDELERLSIQIEEEKSSLFNKLLLQADYKKKVQNFNIPECLLLVDRIRLLQILDNIISNSYKYADTQIEVHSYFIDEYLCVCIDDSGTGVLKEDEIFLMQKYFRGKNAVKKEGSGIGLYVSEYLAKRMGGKLQCGTRDIGGFEVKIYLKLV